MTDLLETHRSFVNTWECDENAHLNVQFYLKRFDEAAHFFDALSGGAGHDAPLPVSRHVRYRAELLSGQTTRVRSAVIADGPAAGWVLHLLDDPMSGTLCATAIDAPSGVEYRHRVTAEEAREALPRSIDLPPQMPLARERILEFGGLMAHRAIVPPAWCDAAGRMVEQHYVGMMSDAAPHVWDAAGVSIGWLKSKNYGRVAVEMKITHHRPIHAGDALELYSAPTAIEGKTVRLRHEILRLDGEAVATSEVIALVIDLASRKSVPMPRFAAAGANA